MQAPWIDPKDRNERQTPLGGRRDVSKAQEIDPKDRMKESLHQAKGRCSIGEG